MSFTPSILIIDDERLARKRIDDALQALHKIYPHTIAGMCDNGHDAWELIQQELPNIVLLDINMPGMSGIDLASKIKSLPNPPQIIFLTAFAEYALNAFDTNATDYLLKPVKEDRLLQALHKIKAITLGITNSSVSSHLPVHAKGVKSMIAAEDIVVALAEWKYIRLLTTDTEYLCDTTLQRLEEDYPALFCRIHRSTLVNIHRIQTLQKESEADNDSKWTLTMRGVEQSFNISRRLVSEVKSKLYKK